MTGFKKLAIVALCLNVSFVQAFDALKLTIDDIDALGWRLEGIELVLSGFGERARSLVLVAWKLVFPEPFDRFEFAEMQCDEFRWGHDEIECRHGSGEIRSTRFESARFDLSFHIAQQRSEIRIEHLRVFGGEWHIEAGVEGERWNVSVRADGLSGEWLGWVSEKSPFDWARGTADWVLDAAGTSSGLQRFSGLVRLHGISGQTPDGMKAVEGLDAELSFNAAIENRLWRGFASGEFLNGAIYIDPFYWTIPAERLDFNAAVTLPSSFDRLDIAHFAVRHPGVAELSANATLALSPAFGVERGRLFLHADNLQAVTDTYIAASLAGTGFEGLAATGRLGADLTWRNGAPVECVVDFNDLDVQDRQGRFGLFGAVGSVFWSDSLETARSSVLSWRELQLDGLSIGSSKLVFLSEAKSLRLLQPARLPLAGGALRVDRFEWSAREGGEPDLSFEGAVDSVSLDRLSDALGWTPLSGTVSGTIPGVDYRNGLLTLDGELKVDVFDGLITIKNLASTGLFSDFSQVFADIAIDRLDLFQLTRKFQFGGIEGRLSGFVQDLYLENWRPVNFFAWLGTPENDDSKHRISQKAVDNLASIGGGGATDLVSRTFLGFFDNFGYEKLGVGCYLNDGVCQLTGVEPAEQGYYIVKGGGLPRIDVMGYNPRVDWQVLLERLERVTATDDVVIE
ncbi:MAG: hypothetical protein Kow0065_03180 [Methylomicrobium sp.]